MTFNEINNFVSYINGPIVFPRIFRINIHSHIQNSQYTNTRNRNRNRNRITAYNLVKKRISEEGFLINVTNGRVIGQSTNIIWRNLTPAEKNIFRNYAIQIRSIIDNRN
ncbi:532_t:CDS:1 [Gigaspora margarita]|uniref:532_t:CDS:1 n=1 Tax=Gigaspora margarita TaxID=4874 RepID=A0ABN7UHR5_GIGMA|nr:532_t:CDS:1 [Gigaspora margarita]